MFKRMLSHIIEFSFPVIVAEALVGFSNFKIFILVAALVSAIVSEWKRF